MPSPTYPPPKIAVQPTCTACGSATYCGGPECPSASLQLAPDGTGMLQEVFVSVPVAGYVSLTNTGQRSFLLGKGF